MEVEISSFTFDFSLTKDQDRVCSLGAAELPAPSAGLADGQGCVCVGGEGWSRAAVAVQGLVSPCFRKGFVT